SAGGKAHGVLLLKRVVAKKHVKPVSVRSFIAVEEILVERTIGTPGDLVVGNKREHLTHSPVVLGAHGSADINDALLIHFTIYRHFVNGIHDVELGVSRAEMNRKVPGVIHLRLSASSPFGGDDDNTAFCP